MPIHGSGSFLKDALDSILAQKNIDHNELTLVAVLDRADVTVLQILDLYSRKMSIKVLKSELPGIVHALNAGIANIENEFIFRLDADDLMYPNRMSKQLEFMKENPQVAVLGSATLVVDESENRIRESIEKTSPKDLMEELRERCAIAHPSVVYRRNAVIEAGGYRSFYQYAEDYDLWLRIIETNLVANLPDFLTKYRQHDSQISVEKAFEQQIATRAAQESYRRRKIDLTDLSNEYQSANEWFLSSSKHAKPVKFFYNLFQKKHFNSQWHRVILHSILVVIINPKKVISRIKKTLKRVI
jgi:glycosyltransferase involved in cell wall biosynthesis